MANIFTTVEIVAAVLIIILVLLQQQSAGLGSAFGGEGNVYRSKRGIEKLLFNSTIMLALILIGAILAGLLIG